jgi:mRNA-degrading endonuclease toxin of MazEF toxin-antitoxin module
VASFDNLHTLRRDRLRRLITRLPQGRMDDACVILSRALGCG